MEFAMKEGKQTRITLTGRLDFARAPMLMQELSTLKGKDISNIIFECKDLVYISSAGIRAIIFAHQKISADMTVTLEDANEDIIEVLEICGLSDFIEFSSSN